MLVVVLVVTLKCKWSNGNAAVSTQKKKKKKKKWTTPVTGPQ